MEFEELTYKVWEAIFEVPNTLGDGLFEIVYKVALVPKFRSLGI